MFGFARCSGIRLATVINVFVALQGIGADSRIEALIASLDLVRQEFCYRDHDRSDGEDFPGLICFELR
jgi:hypothetical protein